MEQEKMMIVLFGEVNQGKTSTLMQLAINLAGGGPIVASSIRSTFFRNGKYWDGRLIIEYKERLIYIATGGDSWDICYGNAEFFENDFHNLTIHKVDATGVTKLTATDKRIHKKKRPVVVITACRPNGDRYGAIKALHTYSELNISRYSEQLWLRKTKEENDNAMANEIQNRIDDFI